jgi:hypothetical protein
MMPPPAPPSCPEPPGPEPPLPPPFSIVAEEQPWAAKAATSPRAPATYFITIDTNLTRPEWERPEKIARTAERQRVRHRTFPDAPRSRQQRNGKDFAATGDWSIFGSPS